MHETRLGTAQVNARELARELLDALNSFKTTSEAAAFNACDDDRQQRTSVIEDGLVATLEDAGRSPSNSSADPTFEMATSCGALAGPFADTNEKGAEQMRFKRSMSSETTGYQTEDRPTRLKIVEEFSADSELIERLRVTGEELEALSDVSLLGSLTCKQDLLFILRQIREPNESGAAVPSGTLQVSYQKIEPSIPDVSEMTERIRREALAKLAEADLINDGRRRSRQFGIVSSIRTMLDRRSFRLPR